MVINLPRIRQNLNKPLGIIGRPAFIDFAVAAERGVHQVVFGSNAVQYEAVGVERYKNIARNVSLGIGQKNFDIPHDLVEIIAFVEQHSVEIAQLFFLELLPFAERVFF